MKAPTRAYLLRAIIADLATDARCADRDGYADYAQACRVKIARVFAQRRRIQFDAFGMPRIEEPK